MRLKTNTLVKTSNEKFVLNFDREIEPIESLYMCSNRKQFCCHCSTEFWG